MRLRTPVHVADRPAALRRAARDAVRAPSGSGPVVLAVATAALSAWMLLPLAFLVPGPPAPTLTAVDLRGNGVASRTGV
ncbi:hypothetical protein QBA75_38045 [Streptomyces stelliscabiei]